MRKLFKMTLTVLVMATYMLGAQAQNVELDEGKIPFKIDDTEFVSSKKSQRNDPMVIGPDLFNQMGEVSNYSFLSVAYTSEEFVDFDGFSADDFVVPTGETMEIKYVRSTFYSPFLTDSIANYNILIYSNLAGKPGAITKELVKQTNVRYETRVEHANMFDVTITLSENITLAEGTYWICIQPVTDIVEPNSYEQPGFWAAKMFQVKNDAFNSQAHIKNPGKGYFPLPDWSSATKYWNTMQGVDYGFYNLNFALYGPEKNKDLAVTVINSPETGDELTNSETVMVTIQNHGLTDVADNAYTVHYRVNGGAWTDEEDGNAISSGAEILYTLHAPVDLSAKGIYEIEVEVVYADDENNDNNILIKSVENFGVLYPAIPDSKVEYTTCEGTFTDHGGLDDIFESYSKDTVVFKPGTSGSRIRLEFYDTGMSGAYPFRFYNGSSVDAPELGDWEALNSSEGIYTQEIHGLVLEGTNAEGAITVIVPGFDINSSKNNFLANVTCVNNEDTDFKVTGIETSKPYSWDNEIIELTALLESRGLVTGSPLVTFFVDGTALNSTVSTTTMEFGEKGTSVTLWTPPTAGVYEITAKVSADDGLNASEKEFTIEHEIYPAGYLVEGFELEKYPPEGWQNKVGGGTSRYFTWYNNRDHWEGKWSVSIKRDTLITPKLDIQETDTIEFIYSAGFFGGTCNIIYAPTPDGPWKVAHTVSYGMPFAIEYKATLKRAVGANYIGFDVQGGLIDFIRGPKLYANEFDLVSIDFTGPIDPLVNSEVNYDFKIRNMGDGTLSGSDYSVKLWKEIDGVDTEIASIPGVDISFSNYHTFTFAHTFTTVEDGNIYATIEYSADEETLNNTSEKLDLTVIKAGVEYVYVGDEASELIDQYTFSGHGGNYAEVIYTKESVGVVGEISGISIYYDGFRTGDVELQLFVGETDLISLEDGFLSTSAMDMVSNGTYEMTFTDQPFKQLYIPFEKPYLYSGDKNLVIAFYRPAFDGCTDDVIMPRFSLQATATEETGYVAHSMQCYERDTDVSDPDVINALSAQLKNFKPNIQFYVKTTEMDASLTGTVTNATPQNLEGVLMSIDGFANTTKTDVDGTYSFPVMPYGDIDVMAEFYGYYNDTLMGTFTAASETVVDFTMVKLPTVEVKGNVIANDSLKPIEGINVYMTGYDLEFFDVTDASGNFSLTGVYGDQDYEITFEHPKYVSQTMAISVSYEGSDLGTITMDEAETPAFNIIANITETGTVDVAWQTPHSGKVAMVDPTLGVETKWWVYNEPDEDVKLGNLFKVTKPGTVTSIEMSNYAWSGSVSQELYLRFYNKDREEILKPVSFMMPDSTVDWFEVEVPNFTYTEDFYVMIHWDRVHEQTPAIMGHNHDDNVAYLIDASGKWYLLSDFLPSNKGAYSIRANVLEEGAKASRALLSYDLWRTELENSSDPSMWTKMNTDPIAGTTYTDATFDATGDGYFMYVVQANYTLASSPYTYSNDINKGMFYGTTVNVTANNSLDITGAKVTMTHTNGTVINTYYNEVAGGKVVFPRVLKGSYKLEVTKGAAYYQYGSDESVSDETTLNVELIENIFTPTMLQVDVTTDVKSAALSWGLGDIKLYQVDDNSAEQALGIGAEGNAQLGNFFPYDESGQITSIDLMGVPYSSGQDGEGKVSIVFYDKNQEIIGKTDEFKIELFEDATMQSIPVNFVSYSGEFYAMVKYSSDEPIEANYLAMDTDDNPGYAYYYDATEGFVQLANWGYYGNFMIRANVLVNGKKSTIVASEPKSTSVSTTVSDNIIKTDIVRTVAKASTQSGTRGVQSYNIFLDNELVAEGVTSNMFVFNETDHLTVEGLHEYKAEVQAVFITDVSTKASVNFTFTPSGLIDNIDAEMVMYPNPATNNITITNTQNSTIEIYSAVGKLVKSVTDNNSTSTIDVTNLTNGTYIIKVKFEEGNIYRNLIINR